MQFSQFRLPLMYLYQMTSHVTPKCQHDTKMSNTTLDTLIHFYKKIVCGNVLCDSVIYSMARRSRAHMNLIIYTYICVTY
jgi:hypothetical protein